MGEYYDWVNIDKKEYLNPADFDLGNKIHETLSTENHLLGALYNLLASDWKGDTIVFLGDETHITKKDTNSVLKRLFDERQSWKEPGYDADYVYVFYKNISCLFKASEETVRSEIEWILENDDFESNPFRIDSKSPYQGLFVRDSLFFRYTINHSKKEFFDTEKTKLVYTKPGESGIFTKKINPLPLLMAFPGSYDECTGLWLGDQIEVSNDEPPQDYADMSEIYGWDY